MTSGAFLLWLAGCFSFVRERGGNNRGAWVEALQRAFGGTPGQPWCAYFVSFVCTLAYGGKMPFLATGGCDEMMRSLVGKGLELDAPVAPCLGFRVSKTDREDAEHVFFVVDVHPDGTFATIDGNTSPMRAPDGESDRDGGALAGAPPGGVYRHDAVVANARKRFFALPSFTPGF